MRLHIGAIHNPGSRDMAAANPVHCFGNHTRHGACKCGNSVSCRNTDAVISQPRDKSTADGKRQLRAKRNAVLLALAAHPKQHDVSLPSSTWAEQVPITIEPQSRHLQDTAGLVNQRDMPDIYKVLQFASKYPAVKKKACASTVRMGVLSSLYPNW